ncbi:hypothetical protein Cflav_PD4995 [Pedosphaera parvula Ellin514]|uniref:Uncharacterized protein n=1 Tax=Pedosphaera parvula (strain Ellin514) TaxID=320771 RepID=B9XD14_PEDPL|nr:hypothetical protein Cflav_PD4995 [Pedosphaera parvula Ellin514]
MRASVLEFLPAKQRVRVLLDFLGRPTPVEVDRNSVALEKSSVMAGLLVGGIQLEKQSNFLKKRAGEIVV